MLNPIKSIVKFNQDAGLLEQGYDDFLESSFQIEEALEGFTNNLRLGEQLGILEEPNWTSAKSLSRSIVGYIQSPNNDSISDVDRLDKACDAVVFAVGSMAKLGLNSQEITKALNVVMNANFAKLKCPKDEFGKLTKPADFVGPEPELQKILDTRGTK